MMKKTIRKILATRGWLHRKCRAALIRWKNHRIYVATSKHRGKLLTLSTADMFYVQVENKELRRYDMIVRYLAVENYYGQNDYGFALYHKMQDARMGTGYGEKAVAQFKDLILSYERNGYDEQSFIVADKNLKLLDGSHRMALALYYHIDNISVLEIGMAHPVDFSIDWFFQKGFTNKEIDLILAKADQLIEQVNRPFSCVIWSPACGMKDEIVKDLGYFGKVGSCKSYSFRPAEYQNVVRAIYSIDDIAKWKIDKKLEHMGTDAGDAVEVELTYDDPAFRVKKVSGMPLSSYGERVKKVIRDRYKSRVENYFHDIIFHIGDSHLQSKFMHKVFEPGIRFREVLDILKPYQYALTKVDVPYMPAEFPDKIPCGKDVDIICSRDSLSSLRDKLTQYAKQYQDYEIVLKNSPDAVRIRFEIAGRLIFQIDCRRKYESVPDEFLEMALLSRRETNGYYVFAPAFEAIFRRVAFEANPTHRYHQEYYEKYKTEECLKMFEKYVGGAFSMKHCPNFLIISLKIKYRQIAFAS